MEENKLKLCSRIEDLWFKSVYLQTYISC